MADLPPPPPPTKLTIEQRLDQLEISTHEQDQLLLVLTEAVRVHQNNFIQIAPVIEAVAKLLIGFAGQAAAATTPSAAETDHRNHGGYV